MDVFTVDRRIVRLGAVVAVLAAAWAADSGLAMHAEHNVAQHVKANSRLENTPDVYVGGLPYASAAWSKELSYLEVKSHDIEVPKLGMVNASTTLRDITVTPNQVVSGDFEDAPVSTYSRGISLDGVALGRLLGITDLSIANPDNISPAGGSSAEAELTGTLPGDTEKTTSKVSLRLEGPMFYMRPYDTTDERVRKAFSLEFDTRKLPLPAQATFVKMNGGTVSFEVQKRNIRLKTSQLSPLEIEGSEEEAVKEAERKAQDKEKEVGPAAKR